MKKTFALGYADQGDVAIWCEPRGGDRFYCLNGAWEGAFTDGKVFVQNSSKGLPAVKLWEGEVPKPFSSHYNSAIGWIREQIRGGVNETRPS